MAICFMVFQHFLIVMLSSDGFSFAISARFGALNPNFPDPLLSIGSFGDFVVTQYRTRHALMVD
jgi:hypothetical protein